MSYELHITHDLRVDYMLWNHNKIVDKEIGFFRKWSLESPPMLKYTHFAIIAIKCSKKLYFMNKKEDNTA